MNQLNKISVGLSLLAIALIGCGGKNNSKTSNRANQNPICKAIMADYKAHRTLEGQLSISGNANAVTTELSIKSGQNRAVLTAVKNVNNGQLTVTTTPAGLPGAENIFKKAKFVKDLDQKREWANFATGLQTAGAIVIKGNLKDNTMSNITVKIGNHPEASSPDLTLTKNKDIKNIMGIFGAVLSEAKVD